MQKHISGALRKDKMCGSIYNEMVGDQRKWLLSKCLHKKAFINP